MRGLRTGRPASRRRSRAPARSAGGPRTARAVGMRYAVLTTKHHDGFCLWDSAVGDYTSARACGRDLVA